MLESNLIYKVETYSLRKCIFEVHNYLGSGFLEAVYQEALEKEFTQQGIPFSSQQELEIIYKGETLKQNYIPDFICYDKIIVEIKAVESLTKIHQAQILNYLKITNMKLGLLVNFGTHPRVEIMRFANR